MNACVGSGEEVNIGQVSGVDANHVDNRVCDVQYEERVSEAATPEQCQGGASGRRKRRKGERTPTETVLRRSARRAKMAAADEIAAPSAMAEDEPNDLSVSGVIDEVEEKPVPQVLETSVEPSDSSLKIELPPSSATLDLEGIPVLDLFTVYSSLRSFSTILYLSPFKLEDLVAALKSKVSNQLIDLVHVSILLTLRKHLDLLASEGCESASTCLRNLNWDLLDEITWPVFMVEYLLLHGSGLKPGFNLCHLKLFDGEYYKQPAEVKIELLRCLCDDVVEVDAIRSELTAEANMESGRTMGSGRKRKTSLEAPGDSCLSLDMKGEVADGNSDECCLCKMDGNLICCDGCPAAYHSRCVGIVSSRLPEGDWYCPECVVGRPNFVNKPQKSIRGAELLGTDPYGRLFFSCFDYLLVSDSYDADLCSFYHKDDLGSVIQLLQTARILYGSILSAIGQRWAFPTDLCQPKSDMGSENCKLRVEANDRKKTKRFIISRYSSHIDSEPSDFFGSDTATPCIKTENLLTSSEGSGEVLQDNGLVRKPGRPVSDKAARGTTSKQRKKKGSAKKGRPLMTAKEEDVLQGQSGDGYVNCYSFACTASSVVEELLKKPSGKINIDGPKTEEEIISIQLKFILNKSARSCWTTIQDLNRERQKEKCGWCYCCRFPVEGRGCLFSKKHSTPIPDALKAEFDGILSKKNKKGHLVDVVCFIISMEERLRGFLTGPWLRPQYSELWRKRVLKASDVMSLKLPLLTLESNLRRLALSADWWKYDDLLTTMGSATHFVASSRGNSKTAISRKKVKNADSEPKASAAGSGLVLFWWRGGNTSRSLFNWKVIPRSWALKVARKAGCMKIPDIQYSDASDNARRTKCFAWRAAVETSTSIEQLALQVREFDLFIRWNDIENTHPHSLLDKESLKSIRLFKKVIIRRKRLEGTVAKYLLDFGKRRSVPDVVLKHGQKFEESGSERKKYWLQEEYVPLYLLKSFEDRRITRKAGKTNSSKLRKGGKVIKKPVREKGFDYLFSRAERADSYQCGHCNKNVPISEAVSCQLCNGYFHKRHVMKSSEGVTAGCTYTCHRCRAGKYVKKESSVGRRKTSRLQDSRKLKVDSEGLSATPRAKPMKKGKASANSRRQILLRNAKKMPYREQAQLQKNTNVPIGTNLRRSARKAKCTMVHSNSFAKGRKRKTTKLKKVELKETPKGFSGKRKRTQILHSFWINGLLLSRKENDERVVQFKRRKLVVPSDFSTEFDSQPKCSLCSQQGSVPALMYIACENCGDWFHGDAFGVGQGNIGSLIGFRCHICRERSPPVCPFVDFSRDNSIPSIENEAHEYAQGLPEVVQKETNHLPDLQCTEGQSGLIKAHTTQTSDGTLGQDGTPMLDSESRAENEPLTCKEVASNSVESQDDVQKETNHGTLGQDGTPMLDSESRAEHELLTCKEVVSNSVESQDDVQKETNNVQELQGNEGFSGLLEAHAAQDCNGTLDQDGTLLLDSELRVGNESLVCKEVASYSVGSHDFVQEEANHVQELQRNEGPSGLLETHTAQNCDGNLDQDGTLLLDPKLRVENESLMGKEVTSCSVESHDVVQKEPIHVHELQCDEDPSGLLETHTARNCNGNLDKDGTLLLDPILRVENESLMCKEVESCSVDLQDVQKETNHVQELQCNDGPSGLLEAHTSQICNGILDQDGTPMLDSELRVESVSLTYKEVASCSVEVQDVNMEDKVLKESDENCISEGNQIS